MPHLRLEATANLRHALQAAEVLAAVHRALLESGVFDGRDVKSRWIWLDSFVVGLSAGNEGFIHASLELLSGRSESARRRLAECVVETLVGAIPSDLKLAVQISCDVRDMNRDCYVKAILTD